MKKLSILTLSALLLTLALGSVAFASEKTLSSETNYQFAQIIETMNNQGTTVSLNESGNIPGADEFYGLAPAFGEQSNAVSPKSLGVDLLEGH